MAIVRKRLNETTFTQGKNGEINFTSDSGNNNDTAKVIDLCRLRLYMRYSFLTLLAMGIGFLIWFGKIDQTIVLKLLDIIQKIKGF